MFVGANYEWNLAGRDRAHVSWLATFTQQSRVFRFAHLQLSRPDVQTDDVPDPLARARFEGTLAQPKRIMQDAGGEREVRPQRAKTSPDDDVLARWVREDFDEIVRFSHGHGAQVILIRYPFPVTLARKTAQDAIDEIGAAGRAFVVDGARIHRRLRSEEHEVFFGDPGMHPRPIFYDEVAREAAGHVLAETLTEIP